MHPSTYRAGLGLTLAATALISLEGPLIRLVGADLWTVVWWRGVLLGSALGLAIALLFRPVGVRELLRWPHLAVVLAFAAAVVCFVGAVQHTSVANTLVI